MALPDEGSSIPDRQPKTGQRRLFGRAKVYLDRHYGTTPSYLLDGRDKLIACGMTAFFFLVYLYTCSHGINVTGDSPELVGASCSLGVIHPPGYPLYTLIGYAFAHIPVGSVAFRLNFSSTLYHSLALLFFFLSALKITRSKAAAAISTAILGFSYLFWFYSLVAEVFPLNDLFAVLLIYVAIRVREKWIDGDRDGSQRLFALLAFLCGLSLTHHQTILFLFPALLLFTAYPFIAILRKPKRLALTVLFFLLGLLPYIYLPISASRGPYFNFGDPSSPKSFLDVVLRRYYGTGTLWRGPAAVHRLDLVFDFATTLGKAVSVPGIALGVVGIFHAARKRLGDFVPLFTALFLTGFLFPFMANVLLRGAFDRDTIERFYLLPIIIFTYFIAMGIAVAIDWLRGLLGRFPSLDGSWRGLICLVILLNLVAPLLLFGSNAAVSIISFAAGLAAVAIWSYLALRRRPIAGLRNALLWSLVALMALAFLVPAASTSAEVELKYDVFGDAYMRDLLASVPDGGCLFVLGDIDIQLLGYYKTALGGGKDIVIITYNFLTNPWYLETMRKWYPQLKLPGPEDIPQGYTAGIPDAKALLTDLIMRNNPQITSFHVLTLIPELSANNRLIPWGITFMMLPRGADLDMQGYLEAQRGYWREFDCRGLDISFYSGNRRELDYTSLVSHYPFETGVFLEDEGYYEEAIRFYELAFIIAPVPQYLKMTAGAYLKLDQPARAFRYLVDYAAVTSVYDPSLVEVMGSIEGILDQEGGGNE